MNEKKGDDMGGGEASPNLESSNALWKSDI